VTRSYVVTGGGRGIGRALVERLAEDGHVVALDLDADALAWTDGASGVTALVGDAGDEALAARWVNNARSSATPPCTPCRQARCWTSSR